MAGSKYDPSGFARVRIKTTVDAEIIRSDLFTIDVETGPLSPVQIRKKRDGITISRPLRWYVLGLFFRLNRARVKIAMPELRELAISKHSSAVVSGFDSSGDFKLTLSKDGSFSGNLKAGHALLNVSGASRAEFKGSCSSLFLKLREESIFTGNINIDGNLEIDISGSSDVVLSGSAGNISAVIRSAGTADLSDFPVHDASMRMDRLSRCMLTLDGRLDAVLTGASDLKWSGTPAMGDISVDKGSILHQA